MQEYKQCPTCSTKNIPSNLSCQKCDKDLWDVPVTKTKFPDATGSLSQPSNGGSKDDPVTSPSTPHRHARIQRLKIIGVLFVVFIVIVSGLFFFLPRISRKSISKKTQSTSGISTPQLVATPMLSQASSTVLGGSSNIGVNDGSFAPFDIGRPTQALKQQAAIQLKAGNTQAAISLWQQALSIESNDAESLIYLEDQRVLASGKYITLIAGTSFTPPFPDGQYESELQGVYVAQHEFNQGNHPFQVRILIANSGSDVTVANTAALARQIVQTAHQDSSVVGVIGWLNSSNTANAVTILAKAKIPIISPQASSDYLAGISPYFFRIVSPNKIQSQAAVQFMKNILHATNPVVFVDHNELYSQNLTQDFEAQFAPGGHLHEETFTTDNTKDFSPLIQDALKYHPDAFYFTSSSSNDAGLFQDALPATGTYGHIPTVGGDGAYTIHKNIYGRWYFTEFAYHDESNTPIARKFAQEYPSDFDPGSHPQKPTGYYGYSLANDHAILAYDATMVALIALQLTSTNGKTIFTPQDLANALPQITAAQAFQGVSGQISFGHDHDPINKAIVILYASKDGHTKMYSIQGCFMKGCPSGS